MQPLALVKCNQCNQCLMQFNVNFIKNILIMHPTTIYAAGWPDPPFTNPCVFNETLKSTLNCSIWAGLDFEVFDSLLHILQFEYEKFIIRV